MFENSIVAGSQNFFKSFSIHSFTFVYICVHMTNYSDVYDIKKVIAKNNYNIYKEF